MISRVNLWKGKRWESKKTKEKQFRRFHWLSPNEPVAQWFPNTTIGLDGCSSETALFSLSHTAFVNFYLFQSCSTVWIRILLIFFKNEFIFHYTKFVGISVIILLPNRYCYNIFSYFIKVSGMIGSHSTLAAPRRIPVAFASSTSEIW